MLLFGCKGTTFFATILSLHDVILNPTIVVFLYVIVCKGKQKDCNFTIILAKSN